MSKNFWINDFDKGQLYIPQYVNLHIYFAVCDYKNKQYTQGQHWTDGCQYNCSCEDAAIGYYRCRNL